MDIFLLFIVSLMWSFVGILVKTSSTMVNSSIISFLRFFIGIIFLGAFVYYRDKKIIFHWRNKWIWIGAIGKCGNYIFENIGLSIGTSYGNIIAVPFQAVITLLISVYYFKEKVSRKHWVGIILCIFGTSLVSWNGVSLKEFMAGNALIIFLFILSAIGIVMHVLSQKVLIKTMDSGVMNLSVFTLSTLITAVPGGIKGERLGQLSPGPVMALIILGFITGVSFFLYANALRKVPLMVAVIISNSSMLLSILWGRIFFKENITAYIIIGGAIFITGVILINLPPGKLRFKVKKM
jgi:drug/metabolite transporter (DMT)-like permease